MPRARSIKALENAFLELTGNPGSDVGVLNSEPIPASGNTAMLQGQLVNGFNMSSTRKLLIRMEGSHDGLVWTVTGLNNANQRVQYTGTGPKFKSADNTASIDYAYLRVSAFLSGSGSFKALFSANVIFTEQ